MNLCLLVLITPFVLFAVCLFVSCISNSLGWIMLRIVVLRNFLHGVWQLNDWPTVWSNFHLWRFIRPVRDTNWLIAHGILPTADRLTRFGMTVDSSCHCGQPESLVHLFTQCPLAKRLIAWYQILVRRVLPTLPRPAPSQILVGYDKSVKIPPVFPCLLGIIPHRIWVAYVGTP